MYSALYFPHTEVRSESLVKTALLTWDKLETIIPDHYYRPQYSGPTARAMEIIGSPRPPSDDDRRQVHALVEELIEQGVPETFTYRPDRYDPDYEMWQSKLWNRTWRLLEENGLVGGLLPNSDYPASQPAGLTLMSIIADVMAGETRTRVTDRGLAYATIANAPNIPSAARGGATEYERVVPLTFKTIAIEHVAMERLIEFREREEKSTHGHDYRNLRHRYLDQIEAHVKLVAGYPPGSPDRVELDRQFSQRMEDDLAILKDELGIARRDAILSKESLTLVSLGLVGIGALAAGGALAAVPLAIAAAVKSAGVVATIGGPLAMAHKYGTARKKVLSQHPMAYLYEIENAHR
jgi:hypothetical protein